MASVVGVHARTVCRRSSIGWMFAGYNGAAFWFRLHPRTADAARGRRQSSALDGVRRQPSHRRLRSGKGSLRQTSQQIRTARALVEVPLWRPSSLAGLPPGGLRTRCGDPLRQRGLPLPAVPWSDVSAATSSCQESGPCASADVQDTAWWERRHDGALPERPKGMHEWTYTRLACRAVAAEYKASNSLLAQFDRSKRAAADASAERAGKLQGSDGVEARVSKTAVFLSI